MGLLGLRISVQIWDESLTGDECPLLDRKLLGGGEVKRRAGAGGQRQARVGAGVERARIRKKKKEKTGRKSLRVNRKAIA